MRSPLHVVTQQLLGFVLAILPVSIAFASEPATTLPADAANVYRIAQQGKWYASAKKLAPQVVPTSDGKSFLVIWKPDGEIPKRWIVSLHGSKGFATDDLAIWYPHLKGRNLGLVSVQWWNGKGDMPQAYLPPQQIYREIDTALQRLGVLPGTVMLHGFSRGSANAYAVVALDRGRGRRYFSLAVASSGGVGIDFPPNRELVAGRFGHRPLEGSRWITVAGGRDQNPERDGISGMRRTAEWLHDQGAEIVDRIEDANAGHGALVTQAGNAKRVLDYFMNQNP